MVHTRMVLAQRGREQAGTAHLTDAAAFALQTGKVDQALRIYRELERLDGTSPAWPLRVAECYRRLAQQDGEVLALMRAASRFEQRGFVREALALWQRVKLLDPQQPSSQRAFDRLEPTRGLGLERMRSSFPPGVRHPPSHIAPAGTHQASLLPLLPTIPAPPPVPAVADADMLDVPIVDAMLDSDPEAVLAPTTLLDPGELEVEVDVELPPDTEVDVPIFDALQDTTAEDLGVAMLAALSEVKAAVAARVEPTPAAGERVAPSPTRALGPESAEETPPATVRAASWAPPTPFRVRPNLPAAPAGERPAWGESTAPEVPAVLVTPVVPVVREAIPMPEIPPVAPLPIFSIGRDTEADVEAEIEFADAEVLPCIDDIDREW